jgi:transcription initiation factor IIE alpha subunit
MNPRRFPRPPKPPKVTPEPNLGAEPERLLKTMDITRETPAAHAVYHCPICVEKRRYTYRTNYHEDCPDCGAAMVRLP